MAIQRGNLLMHGTSGSIGKLVTFKQYNGKTVVGRYPDMSKVVCSPAQLAERLRFRLAVAYARSVIADPVKKKIYARRKFFSAYHAAIAEYLNLSKAEETQKTGSLAVKEKSEGDRAIQKPPVLHSDNPLSPEVPAESFRAPS